MCVNFKIVIHMHRHPEAVGFNNIILLFIKSHVLIVFFFFENLKRYKILDHTCTVYI